MNGFSAADMSTAAANGFRDGLAAQPGAVQEAVPYGYVFTDDQTKFAMPGSGFHFGPVPPKDAINVIPLYAALRAVPEWQPIETAPEGKLVVVGWLDAEDSHYPENYEFDYLEDGLWAKHEDCVEHAHAVAPPGSQIPKEQPPYQWWMDLPAFPTARPQGVK